jgi:hypothetical protein
MDFSGMSNNTFLIDFRFQFLFCYLYCVNQFNVLFNISFTTYCVFLLKSEISAAILRQVTCLTTGFY